MPKFSCYLTDNLLHFHYKDQLVNFALEKDCCVLRLSNGTYEYNVCTKCSFFNFITDGVHNNHFVVNLVPPLRNYSLLFNMSYYTHASRRICSHQTNHKICEV